MAAEANRVLREGILIEEVVQECVVRKDVVSMSTSLRQRLVVE